MSGWMRCKNKSHFNGFREERFLVTNYSHHPFMVGSLFMDIKVDDVGTEWIHSEMKHIFDGITCWYQNLGINPRIFS